MQTRQPHYTTPTPVMRRNRSASVCVYCKRRERRAGLSTCSEACADKRRKANARYRERVAQLQGHEIRHYNKRTAQDGTRPDRLSDEQLVANYRSRQKHHNDAARELFKQAAAVPYCECCGKTLLLCECRPIDANVPQYRDVVLTLDVVTMRRKVEVR